MSDSAPDSPASSPSSPAVGPPPYDESVFINCPFDPQFEPLRDAIVFCVLACGFTPRSALETGRVADSRIDRVGRALLSSRYSIHDLSRCRGEGEESLARFNMPLELGMAIALRLARADTQRAHEWVALVPEGHSYAKFVSDLAGFDPLQHDHTVRSVVRELVPWLQALPGAVKVRAAQVLEAFQRFQAEKSRLAEEGLGRVSWADLILAATRTVPRP